MKGGGLISKIGKLNSYNPSNILEYITSFLLILQCNSLFTSTRLTFLLQVCIFILFATSFMRLSNKNVFNLVLFYLLFSLIMSFYLIFNYNVHPFTLDRVGFFLIDPILLVTYFYSFDYKNMNMNRILLKIENVTILLALISLIFWILAMLGMPSNTYIMSYWSQHIIPGYFHLFYMAQGNIDLFGINILRNTGIFVEAPIYSYVLSISLLIEIFIRKSKILNYRSIILLLTIFTTASSTGIIVSIFSVLYYYFHHNKSNKLLFLFSLLLLIPITFYLIKIILLNKIGTNIDLNSSFNIRLNDFYASIKAWSNHIIIGNGITNREPIIQNMGYWRLLPGGNTGISTGFMSTLACGGIILSLFYVIPSLYVCKISFNYSGMAVFTFIIFIFTIISSTVLYTLLISYFWRIVISNKT